MEERKKRMKVNDLMKTRLHQELTKPRLIKMFQDNLPYLENIKSGQEESKRHIAFKKQGGTRQALLYTQIRNPFSDDQVDWIYAEMAKIWVRNMKEFHDNNDYIWKVLMSECLIKTYMDFFGVDKEEAETRIRETPADVSDSEESESEH